MQVSLISIVGGDAPGLGLLQHASGDAHIHTGLVKCNSGTSGSVSGSESTNTASYIAVHDGNKGDLVVGIAADMEVFHDLDPEYLIKTYLQLIEKCATPPTIVALDANLSVSAFQLLVLFE